jgi:hypothetical protein
MSSCDLDLPWSYPDVEDGHDEGGPDHTGVDQPKSRSLADRLHPPVGGTPNKPTDESNELWIPATQVSVHPVGPKLTRLSPDPHAAIDHEIDAGHVRTLIEGKVERGVGDVFGRAESAQERELSDSRVIAPSEIAPLT